jgi:hypothetical protein
MKLLSNYISSVGWRFIETVCSKSLLEGSGEMLSMEKPTPPRICFRYPWMRGSSREAILHGLAHQLLPFRPQDWGLFPSRLTISTHNEHSSRTDTSSTPQASSLESPTPLPDQDDRPSNHHHLSPPPSIHNRLSITSRRPCRRSVKSSRGGHGPYYLRQSTQGSEVPSFRNAGGGALVSETASSGCISHIRGERI